MINSKGGNVRKSINRSGGVKSEECDWALYK